MNADLKSHDPLLSCKDLWVRFSSVTALAGLSVSAQHGEVLGIVGPNGSGKTTLLNVVAGTQRPSSGSVRLDGHELLGLNPGAIAQLGVARTHQTPRPFLGLSLTENVLARVQFGPPPPLHCDAGGIMEALHLVGLEHKAALPASSLTGTEQTRLELACAYAVRPRLLLLDEIASGLGPTDRERMIRIIGEFRQVGTTILMVDHTVGVVARLCDRVVALNCGAVIAEGPPEEVMAARAVRDAWLGVAHSHDLEP